MVGACPEKALVDAGLSTTQAGKCRQEEIAAGRNRAVFEIPRGNLPSSPAADLVDVK